MVGPDSGHRHPPLRVRLGARRPGGQRPAGGSWTSYGDLAELVGTAAQPTANHVARDPDLAYGYRVLNGDGSFSFNFRWYDDSDTRDPMEVLIGEGVEFDENGCASQAQRLRPAELEALLDPEPPAVRETGS